MKRARIILTSIAVVALVGGALAFNAQKFGAFCVYQKSADGLTCPRINAIQYKAWQGLPAVSITSTNATTIAVAGGACTPDADVADCTTTVTFQAE